MTAHLRKWLTDMGDIFWLLPGLMVLAGIVLAIVLVHADKSGAVPDALLRGQLLYDGGGTGARTLLGAIVASTIGVAGTVFSITIAALSLAAGQMGPRLLRNFVRDRSNQFTLGTFLGTFSYAMMVLRSVRTQSEGAFVPHLALSVAILLAFVCVGTLVYFVGHMAARINVDTVIELVADELRLAVGRLTTDFPGPDLEDPCLWDGGIPIADTRHGYLQQIDPTGLSSWAAEHGAVIRMLVRPGDYVFPGAPIAVLRTPVNGAAEEIRKATALGRTRVSSADLEFAVRQLVEVAVRALSPGINDPNTAISVLDRLGSTLCDLAPRHFPNGVVSMDGRVVLSVPAIDYNGLVDAMFNMVRQNASNSPAVLIRLIEVLTAVASCERDPVRLQTLERHADLVGADAERCISSRGDLDDLLRRHTAFLAMKQSQLRNTPRTN